MKKIGIKLKLLGLLLPVVICIITVIIFLIYKNVSTIVLNKSENLLKTSTESTVNKVSAWMNETITALNMERDTLEYFSLENDEELNYIKHTANRYDSFPAGIYIALTDGSLIHASFVPGPEFNIFEKPWYNDGLKSEEFIFGSVYFDEDSQSYVVGASGLLKDKQGGIRGVAAADIYLNAISEIVKEVQLEQTGAMFLVDKNTNTIIGHKDSSVVGTTLSSQEDPMYAYVDTLIKNNSTGLQQFQAADTSTIYIETLAVPNSNWVTVAYVPHAEIVSDLNKLTTNIIYISLAGIILLVILMERFIHLIVKPVKKLTKTISAMTGGDFTTDITVKTNDEIGVMAESVHKFINVMRQTLTQINEIAVKLNNQAVNSAEVAVSLSTSSNLQSDSMSEMTKTIGDLTSSISEIAENTNTLSLLISDTKTQGDDAGLQMQEAVQSSFVGKENMTKVLSSMKDISEKINRLEQSSKNMEASISKINSIVDLIGDIAEETNLLSLNASIEAARAGDAGRGFAIVADQIGKLASSSGNAVADIANLTQTISSLVSQTVSETADSVDAIHASSELINVTGTAFNTIYDTISQTDRSVSAMIKKVDEATGIAANVAGITEEQSAASEEILATTETMGENARGVLGNSQSVASDSTSLKENAAKLKEYLDIFQL